VLGVLHVAVASDALREQLRLFHPIFGNSPGSRSALAKSKRKTRKPPAVSAASAKSPPHGDSSSPTKRGRSRRRSRRQSSGASSSSSRRRSSGVAHPSFSPVRRSSTQHISYGQRVGRSRPRPKSASAGMRHQRRRSGSRGLQQGMSPRCALPVLKNEAAELEPIAETIEERHKRRMQELAERKAQRLEKRVFTGMPQPSRLAAIMAQVVCSFGGVYGARPLNLCLEACVEAGTSPSLSQRTGSCEPQIIVPHCGPHRRLEGCGGGLSLHESGRNSYGCPFACAHRRRTCL